LKVLDFNVKRAHFKLRMKRLRRTRHGAMRDSIAAMNAAFRDEDGNEGVDEDEEEEGYEDDDDELTIGMDVDRANLVESTFDALRGVPARALVRGRLDVVFDGEEGVDGGGLTREWLSLLMREIFRPSYALFVAAADGVTFQPSPDSGANPAHLDYFELVGRVVGKVRGGIGGTGCR